MAQQLHQRINNIIPHDEITSDNMSTDESSADEDVLLDAMLKESYEGTLNAYDIMVSTVHAGSHQCVKAKDLAKLWRIDERTAKKTLYIT